jgi:transposase
MASRIRKDPKVNQGKHPGGAPTKLNRELIDKLCTLLRMGSYIETAAESCGIPRQTFLVWMKKGANDTRGIYHELNVAALKAMSDSEQRDLQTIDAASQGQYGMKRDWKAAAWKLERRAPKRWGSYQKVELGGNAEEPVRVTVNIVPPKKDHGDST